ncbi:MAG: PHP domain-containing protein [Planctomycetota bacterium]
MRPSARWRRLPAQVLVLAILCCVGCSTAALHPDSRRVPRRVKLSDGREFLELRGQIHIHSRHSHDSSGRLSDILAAGYETGCDYLFITDHNNLGARAWQRRFDDGPRPIELLVGIEYSTRLGHLLDLFPVQRFEPKQAPQDLLDLITHFGGLAIVAHPLDRPPWRDWRVGGLRGMEVHNVASDVAEEGSRLIGRFLRVFLGRSDAVLANVNRPRRGLELHTSEQLRRDEPLLLISGSNAHGRDYLGRVNWDNYANAFALVANYLWAASFDPAGIESALRARHSFIGFDALGDPAGFEFLYRQADRVWIFGDSVPAESGAGQFEVRAPGPARISLFREAELVLRTQGNHLIHTPDGAGFWRVELERQDGFLGDWKPWIISNVIRLESAAPSAAPAVASGGQLP